MVDVKLKPHADRWRFFRVIVQVEVILELSLQQFLAFSQPFPFP